MDKKEKREARCRMLAAAERKIGERINAEALRLSLCGGGTAEEVARAARAAGAEDRAEAEKFSGSTLRS